MSKSKDFMIEDGVLTEYCGESTAIVIPEGVTRIDDGVFFGEDSLLSIVLPKSLKSIGEHAFSCCSGLSEIVIPDNVTNIGNSAFSDCNGLKSVSLGAGITRIEEGLFSGCYNLDEFVVLEGVESVEDHAFWSCNNLKSVILPNSLRSIGKSAFSNCENLIQLIGGENVEIIGNGAFDNTPIMQNECVSIGHVFLKYNGLAKEFKVSEGIYNICSEAFKDCSSIENIVLPDGIISVGDWSFSRCTGLKTINIPNSVRYIEEGAFSDCSSLQCIVLPEGLDSIKGNTFSGCSALDTIQIPDTVTDIGSAAFSGTPWLKKTKFVIIADYLLKYTGSEEDVVVPEGVKKVALQAFSGCAAMKTLTLPEGVEVLEGGTQESFWGCSKLQKVLFPSTLKEIGASVFRNCKALEEVNFPENLVFIGWQAFYGCNSLKTVDIASSHCKIEAYAFADTGIEAARVPAEGGIDNFAFDYCKNLKSITVTTGIRDDGWFNIRKSPALEKVYAPKINIKNFDLLKTEAVLGFAELYLQGEKIDKEIEQSYKDYIKKQRKKLYPVALKDGKLLSYMISENLIPLDQLDDVLAVSKDYPDATAMLLSYKNELMTPKVKNQLEKKEDRKIEKELSGAPMTVQEAKKIWNYTNTDGEITLTLYKGSDTSIIVPNKIGKDQVTGIAKDTFNNVREILSNIEIPETVTNIESQTFSYCYQLANADGLIIVNNVLYKCLRKNISVVIPNGVVRIDDYAFWSCDNLTDVSISESVTEIGHMAFAACPKLADANGLVIVKDTVYGYYGTNETVILPDTVTSIGDQAFLNNATVSEIILPNNIKSIGSQAFLGCSRLADKNGMIIVKDILFGYCGNQKAPVIPEGIKEIGDYAFSGNKRVESIQIPDGVTKIGKGAFAKCTKLKTVILPESVEFIGAEAFEDDKSLGEVNIPKNVKHIFERTFKGCSILMNQRPLVLPAGLISIGDEAFFKIPVVTVKIPKSVRSIGNRVFQSPNITIVADHKSFAAEYGKKHNYYVTAKYYMLE